jgi:hypothetical protein
MWDRRGMSSGGKTLQVEELGLIILLINVLR